MRNRLAFAVLAAALSLTPAIAQSRGGGMGTGGFGVSVGSPGGARVGSVGGPGRYHQGHGGGRGAVLLPYPYLYSDSDYYTAAPTQQPAPPVVVVPAAAPAAPPSESPAPRESLLIEWQGDHFVRTTLSSKSSTSVEQAGPDYSERSAAHLTATRQAATKQKKADQVVIELPPAVLVFHDGRREEVSEYSIISGTIYSKADYWTTGSWTKKIQIADLDVPATLKINQERGLKFVLPTSPNQVVIRP
jgi:hypothetical protein